MGFITEEDIGNIEKPSSRYAVLDLLKENWAYSMVVRAFAVSFQRPVFVVTANGVSGNILCLFVVSDYNQLLVAHLLRNGRYLSYSLVILILLALHYYCSTRTKIDQVDAT